MSVTYQDRQGSKLYGDRLIIFPRKGVENTFFLLVTDIIQIISYTKLSHKI